MARGGDHKVGGMGLGPRFALAMTGALLVVMVVAGAWIHSTAMGMSADGRERAIAHGIKLTTSRPVVKDAIEGWGVSDAPDVQAYRVRLSDGREAMRYGLQDGERVVYWYVPVEDGGEGQRLARLLAMILILVVLVGAGVSYWIASQVVGPLRRVIDDVRQVAKGNTGHRVRVKGGGEIALLARAVDKLGGDLADAQEAELELSMRTREIELAAGVREALTPLETPQVDGYDLRASHLPSGELLGDFYLFATLADGRIAMLVCDVSGIGMPAALIGSTARAYLAAELSLTSDLESAFKRVNRRLAGDVRRGMFVTAMCAVVEPTTGRVEVACAGHKVPLLVYTKADNKLRKVHPGGIAFGFDAGPVFDRSLELARLELAPGDRLVLSSEGPIQVIDPDGNELGEAPWFQAIGRHAGLPSASFIRGLKKTIEEFTEEEPYLKDVSVLTIQREE